MLQQKFQRTGLYIDALSLGKYLGLQKSVVKEFAVTDVRVKTRSETDKTESARNSPDTTGLRRVENGCRMGLCDFPKSAGKRQSCSQKTRQPISRKVREATTPPPPMWLARGGGDPSICHPE